MLQPNIRDAFAKHDLHGNSGHEYVTNLGY